MILLFLFLLLYVIDITAFHLPYINRHQLYLPLLIITSYLLFLNPIHFQLPTPTILHLQKQIPQTLIFQQIHLFIQFAFINNLWLTQSVIGLDRNVD